MFGFVIFELKEGSRILLSWVVGVTEVVEMVCILLLHELNQFFRVFVLEYVKLASRSFQFVRLRSFFSHLTYLFDAPLTVCAAQVFNIE